MARAFTLVEMVVTMIIAAMILLAIGSTLVLASRAIPSANSPTACTIEAGTALDQFVAELESAVYISEHSQTAIAFTVADRNADGLPERIRYAWSGTPGNPLTRQYNGGTVAAFVNKVEQFSLAPKIQSITEAYPGAGIEDAFDSMLVNKDSGAGFADLNVKPDQWLGQHFAMSLPGGSMGWRPTRVKFVVKKAAVSTFSNVCLRPAGVDLKPTSTVLQTQSMDSATLPAGYAWTEFPFSGMDRVAPANAQCMVIRYFSGLGNAATLQGCSGSGLVTSADSGVTWTYNSTSALRAQLYGKVTQPGATQYAVMQYLTAMRIALKVTGTGRTAETIAQTLNQPVLYLGYWEADFSSDPTALDTNGDGAGDWVVHGGGTFSAASLTGGVWRPGGVALDTSLACNFAATTVVDLRMRSTAAGASAVFLINADRAGNVCAPLAAALRLEPEGTQTLIVSRKKTDGTFESLITVWGLPSTVFDLRLLIDTTLHSVSVTANASFVGTYGYGAPAVSTTDKFASIYTTGGNAEFDYVRVRVMEPQP